MIAYAQTALCRWKALVEYFDADAKVEPCGHCDNCKRPTPIVTESAAAVEGVLPPLDERPRFSVGDSVRTVRSERGEVVAVAGENVNVQLEDGDVRMFKREYLTLQSR